MFPRRIRRRSAAMLVACAVVASLAPTASAETASELEAAKDHLTALTRRIAAEQTVAQTLGNQLAGIDADVDAAQRKADATAARLDTTERELASARAEYETLQGKLNALARSAYIDGPLSGLELILDSTSLADLSSRLQYVDRLSDQNAELANQVANLQAQLSLKRDDLRGLQAEQRALLADLARQERVKAAAVAEQQRVVSGLSQMRREIVALVAKLRKQLRAEELAAIGNVFQGSGHISYGAWAGTFLRSMGLPTCHDNMVTVVAWQVAEFTQAAWNPLATTLRMPGSTDFNSFGVQNFVSLGQGLEAVRIVLERGATIYRYGAITSALRSCAAPMTTARAINASSWCYGCVGGTYVTGIIPEVQANYETYAAL